MLFSYSYRTSNGEKHEGSVKARSKERAYALLNAKGIRPIRVEPVPLTPAQKLVRMLAWCCGAAAVCAGAAAIVVFSALMGRKSAPQNVVAVVEVEAGKTNIVASSEIAVPEKTNAGVSSEVLAISNGKVRRGRIAKPLARQSIRGDRARLDKALPGLFAHPAETFLAAFAEPGRKATATNATEEILADFAVAVKEPILVYEDELTECVDLKRIVAGMKREAAEFLAAGGTAAEYVDELAKRQEEGVAYRAKAAEKLDEFIRTDPKAEVLHDAWIKTNAALESWGMAPLPKPPTLRDYQVELEFDE
ncbi:MAG: hypothetical protein IJ802_04445 [Kiritimatiellae bacterium]|nr:hypothetical protein [Kiritimatiellia bacterium]